MKLTKCETIRIYRLEYINKTSAEVEAVIQTIFDEGTKQAVIEVVSYEMSWGKGKYGVSWNKESGISDYITEEVLAKFKELQKQGRQR